MEPCVTNTIFQGYSIPTPSSNIHRCFNSGVGCLSVFTVQGTWGGSESRYINILEMTSVLWACQSFIAHIRDRDLLILSVQSRIPRAVILHRFLFNYNVRVRSRHIAGILNTVADQVSRGTSQSTTEWSLHPELAQSCLLPTSTTN